MAKPLILRPPQLPMVDFLTHHERLNLWAAMGIGKGSAALWALDWLNIMGEVDPSEPTLVIGPARVAKDTWPDELAKWEQFKDWRIVPLTGTPTQRKDKLKIKADIFTISYESAPWLVSQYLDKWPFRKIIADEADRLKGFRLGSGGGMRAHQIARVAHTLVKRWWNMTGTPDANGLIDLWGQNWYVDRGERLGRTFTAFMHRWFAPNWNGHGVSPLPFAMEQIYKALADVALVVDAKDYYDLKDPIVTTIKVHLPPKVRKLYDALQKELFAELEAGGEVEVFNEASLTNKCLQVANGFVYTEHPTWTALHYEKVEAVRSILGEAGGRPILLAYSFKPDAALIKRAFPRAVELSTTAGMKAFRAGDSPIGIAHPKSMGHGIDGLQDVTNILVRFGHTWPPGERLQMLERIGPMRQMQSGLDRNVMVYDIVADDTVDEAVIDSHVRKNGSSSALKAYMKQRR